MGSDTVLYAPRPTALLGCHDATGRLLWVYPLPASGVVQVKGLAAAANGRLYGTGSFQDSLWLPGQPPLVTPARRAPLLLAFAPQGQLDWVQTAAHCLDAEGVALTVDDQGAAYWATLFNGHFAWQPNTDTLQAHWVYRDIFLQKINPQGQVLWAQHGTGAYDNACTALQAHAGQLYMAGQFKGALHGPGWRLQNPFQQHDASYVVELDPTTGLGRWGRQSSAIAHNEVTGLAVQSGRLVLSGHFRDSINWAGHSQQAKAGTEAFRLLLDSTGNVQDLALGLGGGFDLGHGVAWDVGGGCWTVGAFQDSLVWADTTVLTSTGFSSAYLWRQAFPAQDRPIAVQQPRPFTLVPFRLQPNPAYDSVQIVLEGQRLVRWQLYNLQGQLVAQGHQSTLEVSHLPAGTYSLQVQTDGGLGIEKLLVR